MAANKSKEEVYDDEPMVVTLEWDDGTEVETEVMGIFECDGKECIALIPDDDSDDVYIFRYIETDEDDFDIVDFETDEEFERAVQEFDALMEVEGDE